MAAASERSSSNEPLTTTEKSETSEQGRSVESVSRVRLSNEPNGHYFIVLLRHKKARDFRVALIASNGLRRVHDAFGGARSFLVPQSARGGEEYALGCDGATRTPRWIDDSAVLCSRECRFRDFAQCDRKPERRRKVRAHLLRALSHCGDPYSFELIPQMGTDQRSFQHGRYSLSISQRTDRDIVFHYGSIPMGENRESGDNLRFVVERWVQSRKDSRQRTAERERLLCSLQRECREWQNKCEELLRQKNESEGALMAKFVRILNSKKDRFARVRAENEKLRGMLEDEKKKEKRKRTLSELD